MDKIIVKELVCSICGKVFSVQFGEKEFEEISKGRSNGKPKDKEDAFRREALISGMCYDCQSRVFNTPKPGEDWGEQLCECEVCGCPIYKKDNGVCPTCGESVSE